MQVRLMSAIRPQSAVPTCSQLDAQHTHFKVS
jgi:hypothetical protein